MKDQVSPSESSINFVERHDRDHNVHEVRIQVPFGEIAGKWWGPQNVRPILCLHGWQDNAGTFDTLITLLPKNASYLAIDLPGHGYSSRISHGLSYQSVNLLSLILSIMAEYGWKKVSLMGHSMGAVLQFMFAAVFSNKVDFVISLDALKPPIETPKVIIPRLSKMIPLFILADGRSQQQSEPPSYTYDEMINKLHEASFQSISHAACPYLLHRNIRQSTKFPHKYCFTRDIRLKYEYPLAMHYSQKVYVELAKRLTMPFLLIKATGSPTFEKEKHYNEVVELLKVENPNFDHHIVEGSHHVHLSNAERVAPIVTAFLCKYWSRNENVLSKM